MLVVDGLIQMTEAEFQQFRSHTNAQWRPRTPREFDLMVELAIEGHRIDDSTGLGAIICVGLAQMKFGLNGEINFPADRRRDAYLKAHGTWPTDEQLVEFEGPGVVRPSGLSLVKR